MFLQGLQLMNLKIILICAFLARYIIGIKKYLFGFSMLNVEPQNWWGHGYTLYVEIAKNFLDGNGLQYKAPFIETAVFARRPPLYPLLLSAQLYFFGENNYIPIFFQSFIGTATVFITYKIAEMMFEKKVALIAAIICAFYPYYVFHDTALQETCLHTFLTALAFYFILKSCKKSSYLNFILTGFFVGIGSLCKEMIIVMIPFIMIWFFFNLELKKKRKITLIAIFICTFLITITPYVLRNYKIYDKPIFTIGLGVRLFEGNTSNLFSYYPRQSLDVGRSLGKSKKELEKFKSMNEIEFDNWHLKKAIDFVYENPGKTIKYAFMKIGAAYSPIVNPAENKSFSRSFLYTTSYTPILILSVIGLFLSLRRWKYISLIYYFIGCYIILIGIYATHTAARMFLEVYLMILASVAISTFLDKFFKNALRQPSKE